MPAQFADERFTQIDTWSALRTKNPMPLSDARFANSLASAGCESPM